MNFPLLFFLLLIPLSGFIAWAGDRIGHRIGKRRHTFLGMRPRHTATVTTVASGMLISLVSFGLMWASNATFRLVLRDGTALYRNNQRLKKENKSLLVYVGEQRATADRMSDAAQAAGREAEKARREAEQRLQARNAAVKAQKAAQIGLKEAQQQIRTAQTDLNSARASLATTQADLESKEQRILEARRKVRVAEKNVRVARLRVGAAHRRVAIEQEKARSVERTGKELVKWVGEVNTQLEERRKQVEAQQTVYDQQQARLAELTQTTQALEERRARAATELGQTLQNTTALRRGRITYEVGEEVARASLPAGISRDTAQQELWRLLTRAGEKAVSRGAKADMEGRAVVILPKPLPTTETAASATATATTAAASGTKSSEKPFADEADSVAAAADAIRQAGEDVAVLVVASANAVVGEPVAVEFKTFRNRRVLQQNAVLGRITVDGTRAQALVADSLYAFLRRDVRKQLLESGIIPPSPDLPGGLEGEEAETLVRVSGDQWLQLLDEVQRAGPAAQVVVRAAADTRAADTPALRFEVSSASDVSAR